MAEGIENFGYRIFYVQRGGGEVVGFVSYGLMNFISNGLDMAVAFAGYGGSYGAAVGVSQHDHQRAL